MDFGEKIAELEKELLDLKQAGKASSMLRAFTYTLPADPYAEYQERYVVTYAEGDNDIMTEFYRFAGDVVANAPSANNTQYIWITSQSQGELLVVSTRPILSVVKA